MNFTFFGLRSARGPVVHHYLQWRTKERAISFLPCSEQQKSRWGFFPPPISHQCSGLFIVCHLLYCKASILLCRLLTHLLLRTELDGKPEQTLLWHPFLQMVHLFLTNIQQFPRLLPQRTPLCPTFAPHCTSTAIFVCVYYTLPSAELGQGHYLFRKCSSCTIEADKKKVRR